MVVVVILVWRFLRMMIYGLVGVLGVGVCIVFLVLELGKGFCGFRFEFVLKDLGVFLGY